MGRKRKKRKSIQPEDLLTERASATARDLIRMIHRINPTQKGVEPRKAAHRYRLKARLQSLLIRRFGEDLIIEQPDVNQPQLIGIRLRNFDEDACHAPIHELDEDARSWAQRQIDESQLDLSQESSGLGDLPTVDSPAPSSQSEPEEAELSVDELLKLGSKALEEFDYEKSEALYRLALQRSKGGLQPAQALLELLIGHLAADEKALTLSKSFPSSTLKDKEVRIRLATAYARSGRIGRALDTIRRIVEPEAAQVYYLAAKHFVARRDEDRALKQAAALKACGSAELVLETEQLEKDIHALKARRLEPLETRMLLSWKAGDAEEASELAHRLLSLMPENKAARKVLGDIEKEARQHRIESLLQRAREARDRQDFEQETDILTRILAMGKKTPRMKRLLAEAQRQASHQRKKAEVDDLVSSWSAGEREKSLLAYAELGALQRERIRARIHDLHFNWMETALAVSGTVKPLKLARAVLALGQCTEALEAGRDPRQVIEQLGLHGKTLQCLPQAREILTQAETRIRTLEKKEKQRLLAEAEAFVEAGDFSKAGERIEQLKGFRLEEADRKRLEPLKRRLLHFQKIQRLRSRYEESVRRNDEVTGRRLAGRIARLLEDSSARDWADKVPEHTAAIRKQWCLSTAELFELPGCYGTLGLNTYSDGPSCLLLPGSRQVLVATALNRWLFLRAFDLSNRRFHRGYLLQAPRTLELTKATIDGDTVWINDMKGQVFQLRLNPFDVLFWHDFGASTAGETEYEDALLCPQSRILWLRESGATEYRDDVFEIVNIDRARSVRRIKSTGFPGRIYVGSEYRTVLQELMGRSVRICTDEGKVLETFALETVGSFHHAAVHPNGSDYIFLPYDDTGALDPAINSQMRGDFMLVLEVKPDPEKRYKPIKISNSDGEAHHGVATSLEHGIVFAHFFQESGNRFGYRIAAWKPTDNGLEMLFNVNAPENLILACDETSRQVAAVAFSPFEFEARLLDEQPPEFSATIVDSPPASDPPPFEGPWVCSLPTGKTNAASMAFMLQLRNSDFRETRRMMRQMKKNAPADDVAALVYALERMLRLEESRDLRRWMQEKYPDHYLVRIDLADEASRESDWPAVIDLLQGLPREGLDDGLACHLCHLLGMAYFSQGEVQQALGTWKEGLAYENGRCELEPYIEYAEVALRSPAAGKKREATATSAASRMLSIFEQVDRHLAHRQWKQAIAAVESKAPLTDADQQILARLAHAYLQLDFMPGEMRWVCKVLALANFLDCFKRYYKKDLVLPPLIEKWPEPRLAEVARHAEHWFQTRVRGSDYT